MLAESRVEQSFNERLFAGLLDYETLFHGTGAEYHLMPKNFHPGSRRYDDFSLGFFGPDGGETRVSAELKSPDCNLDAPQPDYRDVSPVQQAHRAAGKSNSVEWILVSNFDEIRLYRAGDLSRYQVVMLSDIVTVAGFRRAYALLSQSTLVGEKGRPSPLSLLFHGATTMLIPKKHRRIRLIHEALATRESAEEPLLHRMNDALVANREHLSADEWRQLDTPRLEDERLVATATSEDPDERSAFRLELTRRGQLCLSEYVEETAGVSEPVAIDAELIARRIAAFAVFSKQVLLEAFDPDSVRFSWSLEDVARSRCYGPNGWAGGANGLKFEMPATIETCRYPLTAVVLDEITPSHLPRLVGDVVREILFPYEGRRDDRPGIIRLRPADEDVQACIGTSIERCANGLYG